MQMLKKRKRACGVVFKVPKYGKTEAVRLRRNKCKAIFSSSPNRAFPRARSLIEEACSHIAFHALFPFGLRLHFKAFASLKKTEPRCKANGSAARNKRHRGTDLTIPRCEKSLYGMTCGLLATPQTDGSKLYFPNTAARDYGLSGRNHKVC